MSTRSPSAAPFALALWLLGSVLAIAGGGAAEDAKRLQGTWVVDPAFYKDVKDEAALKSAKAVRFIFEGDKVTIKHPPGNEETVVFRLDPTKKPKQIDMSEGVQGIYELEGDGLKLCWDKQARRRGRPTRFAPRKDDSDLYYVVLKREKK